MDEKLYEALVQRMEDQKDAIADVKKTVTDGFAQMNGRVRTTEKELVRVKTILGISGSGLGVLFAWASTHWPSVKAWLNP